MIKSFKPLFVSILLIFSGFCANSQPAARVTDDIRDQLNKYCTTLPREEVYVHSDRSEYIAGEDFWFSAYVINRLNNKLSEESGLVYIELLNKENIPVIQKRIKIENGIGPGQLLLPDTLSTGPYILMAYTNLMKNSLPENCFIKKISIYNSLNLKASDKNYFLTNKFTVLPRKETSSMGKPAIEVAGNINGAREILIRTNNDFSVFEGNDYSLIIETRGTINYVMNGNAQSEIIRIAVPENSFPAGINHITLFNSKGRPLCEKYTYTPVIEGNIRIYELSNTYGKREKVSFSVASSDDVSGIAYKGNLSISVIPETESFSGPALTDYMIFGSEFGMAPWEILKGRSMADLASFEIDSLLMNLKSNWIDWERILSEKLTDLRYPAESNEHFLPGRVMNSNDTGIDSVGFVLMSVPGKAAQFQYAKTDTKGFFNLKVGINQKLNDLVIQPDNSQDGRKVKMESSFSDRYMNSELTKISEKKEVPQPIKNWGGNFQVKKIYGTSYYGDPLTETSPEHKLSRFYGKPDLGILLDDYIKLPVMEEVFFELIPGVFLKRKKSVFEIKMADPVTYEIYEYPPGMMIDGVIVKDPTLIGDTDPEIVERIDIIKDRYFIGDYLFFGIINVITKAGDFSSVSLPDFASRISYRVVEPVLTFATPDYSLPAKKNDRIPDFRNTLWWSPSVSTGNSGNHKIEFWTSDVEGSYVINIQGITSEGRAFYVRKLIKVE